MLSVSAADIDGEWYCAVNTGLHCQFKYSKHQGSSSFSHFLCRQQVQAEAPGPGPWPLSALLKAFPQPEIKPSAQWQTSGSADTRPGSKEGAGGGGEGWRERKRENEGKVGERVENWDSKGAGRWVWGGESGKLVYQKGGEELWRRQRKTDEGSWEGWESAKDVSLELPIVSSMTQLLAQV